MSNFAGNSMSPLVRTILILLVLVLATLCCAERGFSAEEEFSLEETLEEMNQRISSLEWENSQLRRLPALKEMKEDSNHSHGTSIEFSGRIHVDHWGFPADSPGVNAFDSGSSAISPQDRLELRRARFAAEGVLPFGTIYKLDFELSEAADPEFRDLYIGWSNLPLFGELNVGNQKRPYGLDHLNSSNLNVMMERPFINQAFNRNNRRWGLAAYGVSENERWNWRYGTYNLKEIQTDGVYSSDHYQMEIAGRLAHTLFNPRDESRYIHLAIASNYAEPDGTPGPGREENQARFRTEPEARTRSDWLDTGIIDGAESFSILGLENVVNVGRLQFTGEYMNLWLDRELGFGDSLHFHGGYIQLAFFITDHFQPWNRRLGIIDRIELLNQSTDPACWRRAWQLAVRWSFADLSDSDILGGVGESIAAGLNWYWTPRSRLQMNCIYGNITDHAPVDGQTEGDYVTIGTRVMVDF